MEHGQQNVKHSLQFVYYEGCEFIVENRIKLNLMYCSEYYFVVFL